MTVYARGGTPAPASAQQPAVPASVVRRPRVCIVAPFAWPLLAPGSRGSFGGAEVRAVLLGRELARRGAFDVDMVVYDHGQGPRAARQGILVHSRPGERPPSLPLAAPRLFTRAWLRRLRPAGPLSRGFASLLAAGHLVVSSARASRRSRSIVPGVAGWVGEYPVYEERLALYESIGADLWMVAPGGLFESAEVAFHARRSGTRFVFLASSDADLDPELAGRRGRRSALGASGEVATFAIENAAGHVVQSEFQMERLRRGWGRSGLVLRNPLDGNCGFSRRRADATVLWVGKSSSVKRPLAVIDIARRLPSVRFVVVLNVVEEALHCRFLDEAKSLLNLEVREYVPFAEIERLYAEAAILLNTSEVEGFPNAFLQAAKYGVPVVSLSVDPGGMLTGHGAGFTCNDDTALVQRRIDQLLLDDVLYQEIAARAQDYVRTFHDKDRIVDELERYLGSLVAPLIGQTGG